MLIRILLIIFCVILNITALCSAETTLKFTATLIEFPPEMEREKLVVPVSLNDHGVFISTSGETLDHVHGFSWNSESQKISVVRLDAEEIFGEGSSPIIATHFISINNHNEIVGIAMREHGDKRQVAGIRLKVSDHGDYEVISSLYYDKADQLGSNRVQIWDINDDGLMVGLYPHPQRYSAAAVFETNADEPSSIKPVRLALSWSLRNAKFGEARVVNNKKYILGQVHNLMVVWNQKRLPMILPVVGSHSNGAPGDRAYDMNNSNVVVGVSGGYKSDGEDLGYRPIVWERLTEVPTLLPLIGEYPDVMDNEGSAEAINNAGWIVGSSTDPRPNGILMSAVLWMDTAEPPLVLHEHVVDQPGLHLRDALDVNNKGQIIASGNNGLYLLTPVVDK